MPKLFLSLIFIGLTSIVWGQETQQQKLEFRKAQLQQEIRDNEKQLQTVKKKEKTATHVIALQSDKIKLKETLIHTTEKQTQLLGNNILINQVRINILENELALLKEDYAKMIVKSYKSRSEESRAMFLLSSKNFIQAYKRAQYMKQYTNYRKMQGEEIQSKSIRLSGFNDKLNIQKIAKQKLIAENEQERSSLEKEKQEQEKLVNSLKKDKEKIAKAIKKSQQESRTIDKKIDKLIRAAIAEANRKAAIEKAAKEKAKADALAKARALEKAKALEKIKEIEKANAVAKAKAKANSKPIPKPIPIPKEVEKAAAKATPKVEVASAPVSSTKIVLTNESKIESDNFKNNKGRLPWPVEKGFISLGYGDQAHPVYKTLVIHNSGLEITTDSGANARAVFGGEVTSVMVLSPVNKAVMIQHGDFFTVYQNLSSVLVSKGDKVNIKQILGKIRMNGEGKTILKFIIYQNTMYTNPKVWLSKK